MKTFSVIMILLLLFTALAFVMAPTAVLAGGRIGGANNADANSFHCKSGKTVKASKACKENGGKN
jgi:hypothetical protein